jgi:hypothetical protein
MSQRVLQFRMRHLAERALAGFADAGGTITGIGARDQRRSRSRRRRLQAAVTAHERTRVDA